MKRDLARLERLLSLREQELDRTARELHAKSALRHRIELGILELRGEIDRIEFQMLSNAKRGTLSVTQRLHDQSDIELHLTVISEKTENLKVIILEEEEARRRYLHHRQAVKGLERLATRRKTRWRASIEKDEVAAIDEAARYRYIFREESMIPGDRER